MTAFYSETAESQLANSQATSIARWEAQGDFYRKLAEVESGSDVNADVTRWISLGEYFSDQNQSGIGVSNDVFRWIGLGDHYQKKGQIVDAQQRPGLPTICLKKSGLLLETGLGKARFRIIYPDRSLSLRLSMCLNKVSFTLKREAVIIGSDQFSNSVNEKRQSEG